jgi:hypothetical protein
MSCLALLANEVDYLHRFQHNQFMVRYVLHRHQVIMQFQQSGNHARESLKRQEQICCPEMVQDLTRVVQEEHIHILSTQSLQGTIESPPSHAVLQPCATTRGGRREDSGDCELFSSPRPAPTVFSSLNIVQHAACLDLVPQFNYLYTKALICIERNGLYALDEYKSLVCVNMLTVCLSEKQFAQSLALAQDHHVAVQSCKRVSDDLMLYATLGSTTVKALEWLLDLGDIELEPFVWGVLGLSSGYRSYDPLFIAYKQKLYTAINLLSTSSCNWSPSVDYSSNYPAKALNVTQGSASNKEIHRSATMLLQIMRRDWTQLRWYHGIKIVRRWFEHLEIIG